MKLLINTPIIMLCAGSLFMGTTQATAKPRIAATAVKSASFCKEASQEITNNLKKLAMLRHDAGDETSAVRAGVDQNESNGLLTASMINLDQMKQQGCKPYPFPISTELYSGAAAYCALGQGAADAKVRLDASKSSLQSVLSGGQPIDYSDAHAPTVKSCDMNTWTPNNSSSR